MKRPNFWTVERLQKIHMALMALSEEVKGTNYRVIKQKVGLGRLTYDWLHRANRECELGMSEVNSGLRMLACMGILQESQGRIRREGYERIFYSSIEIVEELIDTGYEVMRTKYK